MSSQTYESVSCSSRSAIYQLIISKQQIPIKVVWTITTCAFKRNIRWHWNAVRNMSTI